MTSNNEDLFYELEPAKRLLSETGRNEHFPEAAQLVGFRNQLLEVLKNAGYEDDHTSVRRLQKKKTLNSIQSAFIDSELPIAGAKLNEERTRYDSYIAFDAGVRERLTELAQALDEMETPFVSLSQIETIWGDQLNTYERALLDSCRINREKALELLKQDPKGSNKTTTFFPQGSGGGKRIIKDSRGL